MSKKPIPTTKTRRRSAAPTFLDQLTSMLHGLGMPSLLVGRRTMQPTDKGDEPDEEMYLNILLERPDAIDKDGNRCNIVLTIPFDQQGRKILSKPALLHPGECNDIFFL